MSAIREHNPFAGMDIRVPNSYRQDMDRFCMGQKGSRPDDSPFPRKIDMWFAAMAVAANQGLSPIDSTSESDTHKMMDGSIFSSDPWRIQLIHHVAIAETGSVEVILNPRKVLQIANGLSWAGLPTLIQLLKNHAPAIWSVSEHLDEIINELRAPSDS